MNDTDLHATAQRLVQNEVCYCVSGLVYAARQNWDAAIQLGFSDEDLCVLASRRADASDYRNAADENEDLKQRGGVKVEQREDGWHWSLGTAQDPAHDGDGPFQTEREAFDDAFSVNAVDEPDGAEIFEHWLISDWLADKLEARGESIVRDALGLTIWGRATTGQAIAMDSVIEAIARELHTD